MTESLAIDGGTIAYEVHGAGPLVVLAHGMGDSRQAYRFMVPELVAAGYRVASVDIRGCGESSTGWPSYTRTALAGDLLALVRHLGGPAVLIGHSISGGSVSVAAATASSDVTALVEIAPFTRKQSFKVGDLGHSSYRKGMLRLMGTTVLGSIDRWNAYLDGAYPGTKPADWVERQAEVAAMLGQKERMKVLQKMGTTSPADAGEALPKVACQTLVVEGSLDPDWVSPHAEGQAIVDALPAGLGHLVMIDGAGHYPHAQCPAETLAVVLPFLASVAPTAPAVTGDPTMPNGMGAPEAPAAPAGPAGPAAPTAPTAPSA